LSLCKPSVRLADFTELKSFANYTLMSLMCTFN